MQRFLALLETDRRLIIWKESKPFGSFIPTLLQPKLEQPYRSRFWSESPTRTYRVLSLQQCDHPVARHVFVTEYRFPSQVFVNCDCDRARQSGRTHAGIQPFTLTVLLVHTSFPHFWFIIRSCQIPDELQFLDSLEVYHGYFVKQRH